MKLSGKPGTGNPYAGFDEAGAGNGPWGTAPVLDPTDEGELEIELLATTPALYSTVLDKRARNQFSTVYKVKYRSGQMI